MLRYRGLGMRLPFIPYGESTCFLDNIPVKQVVPGLQQILQYNSNALRVQTLT